MVAYQGLQQGLQQSHMDASSGPSKNEATELVSSVTATTAQSLPAAKCTLPDGHKHGWKPRSTSGPILAAFSLCSLIIAAILEALAQKSQKHGGLAVVSDAKSMPLSTTFSALYLPIIIAVIYSLAWNWIDLDFKRMQPWLELSKQGGATGQDSLFLDYPFDFVALVPFKAARRRHWAIFYSGTIMVLIFWLITPLQSSVIGTGPVLLKQPTTILVPSKLSAVSAQSEKLDQGIPIISYAIAFLGQSYPGFATAEYSLLPSKPAESLDSLGRVGNWTGITTKYWVDLDCWPAVASQGKTTDGTSQVFLDSGTGYNASMFVSPTYLASAPYEMSYWGSQKIDRRDNSNDANASTQFFVSWFNNTAQEQLKENPKLPYVYNVSAVFCEPHYYKQTVSATVRASDLGPIDGMTESISAPETLHESEFNSSAFGELLSETLDTTDWFHSVKVALGPRMEALDLITGYDNSDSMQTVIGFAIKGQNYTIDEYGDASKLEKAISPVYKSYFSLAIQQILTNDSNPTHNDGHADIDKYGVVVSRIFSAVVEGMLCLVAVLTMLLYWSYRRSPIMLSHDPGWLGDLMGVIHSSEDVLEMFSNKGNLSDEKLLEACGQSRFRLVCGCQDNSGRTAVQLLDRKNWRGANVQQSDSERSGHYSPIQPLSLRRPIGAVFAVCLCAGAVTIAVLKQREVALKGLQPPSSNFEVNLIVINFIPTGFATLVEPFWVLLNRLLGIFQPFHDLISGKPHERSAQQCLRARYTAMPPQLALWPALKAKHYLLAAVSIIALLANVLAVGLGALFNELPVQAITPVPVISYKDAKVTNQSLDRLYSTIKLSGQNTLITGAYGDPYYVAYANLTSGTPFQPWITEEFAFMPVNISTATASIDDTYSAITTGIGVDPSCIAVGPVVTTKKFAMEIPPEVSTWNGAACSQNLTLPRMNFNSSLGNTLEGFSAFETVGRQGTGVYDASIDCGGTFYMGWTRGINATAGKMNSSYVVCRPELKTAEFRISFDSDGFIHTAAPVSDFKPWMAVQSLTSVVNVQMGVARPSTWHNTTASSDWMNHLLKIYLGDDSFLDPAAPTPDPNALIPSVGAIYKMIVANYMGLNQYIFIDKDQPSTIDGTRTATQTRVFLSQPGFIVSFAILILYVLATIIVYMRRAEPLLPRMPTTIGSLIAYIAPSKVLGDYSSGGLRNDSTLGFGRYVGKDGRAHIGIEYSDRIVPVDLKSLARGDTKPTKSRVGRLWYRKKATKQGDTWL
ncbi:Fc.00g107600.m01.CDS01 [Cosmosporella sp. VM-42]